MLAACYCFTHAEKTTLFKKLFEDLAHNRGQTHWTVVGNVFWVPFLNIGQITAVFQSPDTTAVVVVAEAWRLELTRRLP